jgi:hypothetical protein
MTNIVVQLSDGTRTYYTGGDQEGTFTGISNALYPLSGDSQIAHKIYCGTPYTLSVLIGDYRLPLSMTAASATGGQYYVLCSLPRGSTLTKKRLIHITECCKTLDCELSEDDTEELMLQLWNNNSNVCGVKIAQVPVTKMNQISNNTADTWSVLDGHPANAEDIVNCFHLMFELLGASGVNFRFTNFYFHPGDPEVTVSESEVYGSYTFRDVPDDCPPNHSEFINNEFYGFCSLLWGGWFVRAPVVVRQDVGHYLIPMRTDWYFSQEAALNQIVAKNEDNEYDTSWLFHLDEDIFRFGKCDAP